MMTALSAIMHVLIVHMVAKAAYPWRLRRSATTVAICAFAIACVIPALMLSAPTANDIAYMASVLFALLAPAFAYRGARKHQCLYLSALVLGLGLAVAAWRRVPS